MENDNLNIFDPSDLSQKDDMLRALQSAYASVSPEAERGYVKRSAKTGVPVPLLRAKDNRALDTPTDLSELSSPTKQLLLGDPSLAIIARGEEKQLDAVRGVAAAGEKPLEVRKSELEEQIRARGYTAAQKQQLKEAGFQQLPSGKWLAPQVKGQNLNKWNSGVLLAQALDKRRVELEEVDMPLLPEWYASYNERLSEPLKEFMRNGSSGVIPEELKLQGLTEQDITKALVTDQTLMRALNTIYGTAWRNYDDENLTAAINRVGTALKLDVENYDLARVRERGFSEGLDPMIFKDFLGLASVWKALTSDGTEIESLTRTLNNLDKASPEELKALNDYLLEQNRNMRGSTTGVSLTEGVLESGRFAGELFATGGKSVVTRWALSPLRNAGFLRTAGMLLKDIAKGELKRLPYYLPGIVGKEINEAQTLQAFIDDDGGMKAALSEKSADKFALGIANRVIDTYLTNFSERTGIVLDIAGTSALRKAASAIPAPLLRSAIGQSVRARFGEMTAAKWHTLYKSFLKDANVSGVYGEYAEEKIDTFLKWASTSIAQTLDTRLGDFGVNEVFGSPAEEAALFGRVALTTGVFKAPGVALSVRSLADTSRFIDAEKGLKTAFSNMESLSQSPEMVAKVYRSMNLPATGHTEPAKLRVLAQSEEGSDILEKLGVTEEELARAENEGSLVEIPLDKAMGNLDEAQHARLMDITTPADVYSNATAEHLREIEDKGLEAAVKEREEFTKAYDEALAQLSSLGRSTSEVRAAAKILGSFADYFARESGMTAAEWIRNVAFKKMKEADWVNETGFNALYQDIPSITRPEGLLLDPENEAEVSRQLKDANGDITKTPFFKRFFGDWEKWSAPVRRPKTEDSTPFTSAHNRVPSLDGVKTNIAQSGKKSSEVSVIVDQNGKPLLVYHGTTAKPRFTTFRRGDVGYHFGTKEQASNRVSEEDWNNVDGYTMAPLEDAGLLSGYLNLRNPLYIPTDFGDWHGDVVAEKLSFDYDSVFPFELTESDSEDLQRIANLPQGMASAKMREWLIGKGFDGIVYENTVEGDGASYIIFSPEQFKSADNLGTFNPANKNMYFQGKGGRRGATVLNKDVSLEGFNDSWKATVVLFENAADASTLVHEIEHYAVHMMECLVNSGLATERMASDLRTLEEWALREVGDAEEGFKRYRKNKGPLSKEEWLNVEMNEKIAKAFERFVMEGVAPSAELVGAFSTLKRLMTAVYKSVAALGVPVSDEVRAVFQGMLASEKAVEQSSELMELLKEIDTGILGANQDEIKAFRDLIGLRNDQAWAELDAEKNRQLKELRPVWRKEAEELVKDDPVFSAWKNAVKAGGMDFEALLEIAGEEEALALRDRGLTTASGRKVKDGSYPNAKKGVHPAEIAKDFDSVEDMVLALLKSDSPYRFVESYVNESETSFVENFSMSDAALSVDAATELFERLSATLEKLSDAKGRTLRLAELRVKVDQEIKGFTVDQILNDRKAAKESASHTGKLVEAIARKDYATAFTEVTQLRHKLELLKHKAFAQKVIRRMDRTLKKGVKAKQGKIEGPYQEALFEIATKFGFSRKSGDFRGKVTAAILEFNKRNPDASMEFSWFDAMEGKSFKDLLFSEVERLAPLTEFLYEEGRYLVSDAKMQESAARKELSEKAVEELSRLTGKLHEIAEDDRVKNAALFVANYGSKLRNIIGWSTNWDENSVIKRSIYDPLMEAQSQSLTLSGEAKRKVKDALDRLAKRSSNWDLKSISDITFPEELRRRFKRYRHWDAEMVVMLCLNMGTAKNIQRMDSGYEWGDMGAEYRSRISALLSAEDWKDIQEVWNAINDPKITSRLKTTFRNIYHYDLPMEEPASFTVRTSDGAEVALAGGYLPKWYAYRPGNLNASGSTDPMKEKAALPEYRRASFTLESLDEYNAPLDITNSNKIISHILDVAYYVTHAEVLRKVLPVVRDGAFASEFKYRRGAATYNAMMKILDNIAKPGEWMEGQTAWWENFSRSLTTALSLWGSFRTAASQFSGTTVGLEELRDHYLDALVWFYKDTEKAKNFIYARSGFMRDRGEHFELDMKLMADSSFKGTVKRYNSGLRKIGSFLTTQADMLVACPLWIAAYNKALDATEDDVRAAAEADEFVAKTQGGSRPIDLSTNQLDAFGRVATMFFSSSSAQATHSSALIGKMIRDKRFDLYAITYTLAAPRVLIALVSILFAGSDDDDDDFFKAFGKELLTNAFSGVPVAEGVIRFFVEGDTRGLSDVTLLRAPARIVSSGRDVISSLVDGEYGRAVYRVAEAASILNGTPVTVAYDRIIRYAEDWTDKDLPLDFKEDVGIKKANNRKDNK